MNEKLLSKLSSIAEIISSVAVLGTLVYLAVQTRQNTEAIQAQVRAVLLATDTELIYKNMEYPELVLSRNNPQTEQEKVLITSHILVMLRQRENYWIQYRNGVLDEETWISYRNALGPTIFYSEYGTAVWEAYLERGNLNPGFMQEVET
jgi:hypothetical protein